MNKEIMTIKDLAEYLQISIPYIRILLRDKDIPASKIGKVWRFNKGVIDKWMENKNVLKEGKIN